MPANLTGEQINNIYTSLLHISSTALTNITTPIFDGVGNRSALYLSTSSVSVTGSFALNNVLYPSSGTTNGVLTFDGTRVNITSLASALSTVNSAVPADGTYSSPTIAIQNGILTSIVNSGGNKTFFYPARLNTVAGPSKEALLSVVSWQSPTNGDKANVIQKVTSGPTLVDLSINVFTYNGTEWTGPVTY